METPKIATEPNAKEQPPLAPVSSYAPSPRWEHGYRCHGYWLEGQRVGCVGLGPRSVWDGIYRCGVWIPGIFKEVEFERPTLKAAKAAVERAFQMEWAKAHNEKAERL